MAGVSKSLRPNDLFRRTHHTASLWSPDLSDSALLHLHRDYDILAEPKRTEDLGCFERARGPRTKPYRVDDRQSPILIGVSDESPGICDETRRTVAISNLEIPVLLAKPRLVHPCPDTPKGR